MASSPLRSTTSRMQSSLPTMRLFRPSGPYRNSPVGTLASTRNSAPRRWLTSSAASSSPAAPPPAAAPEPKAPSELSEGERRIYDKLASALQPTQLEVVDTSGGCGSMYTLTIVSPKFADMTIVKQHQLVNRAIADEIKQMHGLQMVTRAS